MMNEFGFLKKFIQSYKKSIEITNKLYYVLRFDLNYFEKVTKSSKNIAFFKNKYYLRNMKDEDVVSRPVSRLLTTV